MTVMRPHPQPSCSRRGFLRASAVGAALVCARLILPQAVWAQGGPVGKLTLLNLQTDERLSVVYRNEEGRYDESALNDLNYLLRCHHTNQSIMMDVQLIEFLNLVQLRLGGRREVHVISGYRSPEYNAHLIDIGKRAARHSYHVSGQAVDIQIPGVPLRTVRDAALRLGRGSNAQSINSLRTVASMKSIAAA